MNHQPYTHAKHWLKCFELTLNGASTAGLLVQAQKRGVTYCARIKAPWVLPTGLHCWTVDAFIPEVTRFTVPVRQVLECGQADCSCISLGVSA